MYKNNYSVAIKVNDKFIKSTGNEVYIPENSEYCIYIKNKSSRRALAKVFIDGENVTEGGLIIKAESSVLLERSVSKARKFKFVSSESKEAFMSDKDMVDEKEKGRIEVQFYSEKVEKYPPFPTQPPYPYDPNPYKPYKRTKPNPWDINNNQRFKCNLAGGQSLSFSNNCSFPQEQDNSMPMMGLCSTQSNYSFSENIKGVTVDGNYSNQSFVSSYIETEDSYTSIVFNLRLSVNKSTALNELDRKIEELQKRKRILELEKEIQNLNSKSS